MDPSWVRCQPEGTCASVPGSFNSAPGTSSLRRCRASANGRRHRERADAIEERVEVIGVDVAGHDTGHATVRTYSPIGAGGMPKVVRDVRDFDVVTGGK